MRIPPFLRKGDKIGIVSTARKISTEELCPAIEILEKDGFEVVLGKNIYAEDRQFAGTDEQRAQDIQQMMDDPSVKAILFARGGYGTIRIMDKVNFDHFVQHPKWMIGYSDVTVIHSHINKHCKVASMHATMPLNFPKGGNNPALAGIQRDFFEG